MAGNPEETENLMTRQATVIINGEIRIFGKVKGWAVDIDDPLELRRVRLKVPSVGGDKVLPWALPCDKILGDWLPKPAERPDDADILWVEFEAGHPDIPIWCGRAVAAGDVDAEFLSNYGHEFVTLYDHNGNYIRMTKDQGTSSDNAVVINGDKTLATKDYVDWIQSDLIAWLKTHKHTGNQGAPTPLFPGDLTTLNTKDTDYTSKKAASGGFLTDHLKGG